MLTVVRPRRLTIAVKLYCLAALSLIAVGSLALASIHFAQTTQQAARSLYEDGFVGLESATQLEVLVEQHRRLVESAPAELDRDRLGHARTEIEALHQRISARVLEQSEEESPLNPGLAGQIAKLLPEFGQRGKEVLFYAHQFAQDKASELVSLYQETADAIQEKIHDYRRDRLAVANKDVSDLYATASSLVAWVLICTAAALLLLVPVGLFVTHGVLRRLRKMTAAMNRLAGNDLSVEVPSRNDSDEVGDMARATEVFKANSITLLERTREIQKVNLQLDIALNNMAQGLCMFDADQRLIVCNDRFARMYKLEANLAIAGTTLEQIRAHRAAVGNSVIESVEQEATANAVPDACEPATLLIEALMDGRTIAVTRQEMRNGTWVAVHEDITERQNAEARTIHLALHDALTDLPNRVLFRETLEKTLRGERRRKRGRHCAVLLLDLDRFKGVNDTLGHPSGDRLLQAVGERLRRLVRDTDTVARLGGDEFAIIQANVEGRETTENFAERLVQEISNPYDLEGHTLVIGVSIGVAVAPSDGSDPDELLKNADLALYLAKAEGRGIYRFFKPEMSIQLQAQRVVENDLRQAIARGEFEMHYQPIVDLGTRRICGFESLVRWKHPERGMVYPGDFIPIAENTNLILQIGEWTLRQACVQAASWPRDLRVAVNLSSVQFRTQKLIQMVFNALAFSRLAPEQLELEITESVLLEDNEKTVAMLHQLRSFGVRIAMDDFGTGYSSLSYLQSFPFDKIKIDRSFTRDIAGRSDGSAIVRAVASLGESLGITTVAEGLETAEQVDAARAAGCTQGQGYYFGRPVSAKTVDELLKRESESEWAAA